MSGKREDAITKKEMYMLTAIVASKRSKDPSTQVGASLISEDGRILSIGYNGFPNGCSDDDFPWERIADDELNTKYPYVVHSELNAILNFRGSLSELQGATLYVTLFPCNECAKAIIQAGIKRVFYLSDKYDGTSGNTAAKKLFDAAGVTYIKFNSERVNNFKFE